ncbi:hypothetical protein BASA81_000662 [Batrachochytrium salamandrivorans]|nr:hypothetical protein BASA81_000662 [Batrachochytrium salamandrivorans]
MLRVLLLLALLVGVAMGASTTSVLFVGNSLTSKNNLPLHLKTLAQAAGRPMAVFTSLKGSSTLCDHVRLYDTLKKIRSRKYSVVVLQDQSSYLARGLWFAETSVWPCAKVLAEAARNSSARVVLYETMAYTTGFGSELSSYELMQQEIVTQYEALRNYLGCETAHVGTAFALAKTQLAIGGFTGLYAVGDVKHPSQRGTFLAASTMYATIYNKSPVGIKLLPWLARRVYKPFALKAQKWAANATLQ